MSFQQLATLPEQKVFTLLCQFINAKAVSRSDNFKPNMNKYKSVCYKIRSLMLDFTPLIEPISLDEAFLDLSGTYRLHKKIPAILLADLVNKIEKEIQITCFSWIIL